jgi:hypothetical protein
MKWTSFVLAVALAVGVVGCNDAEKGKGTVKGKDDKQLTLTAPGTVTIKQGSTEQIKIKIDRKKFDDPVDLSFSDLPKGVTVKESDTKIDKGATDRTLTLEAKDDATIEDGAEAKVTAKSGDMKVTEPFKVNVKKK